MMDLLYNPVTVIAGILSVFFILMAYGRRIARKRLSAQTKPPPAEERYTIVDPFEPVAETTEKTEPAARESTPAVPPSPEPTAPDPAAPGKTQHLVEYKPQARPAAPDNSETSGYVWE